MENDSLSQGVCYSGTQATAKPNGRLTGFLGAPHVVYMCMLPLPVGNPVLAPGATKCTTQFCCHNPGKA
jgi:hypothetical protein